MNTNPRVVPKVLNEYEVRVTVPHALLSLCASGVDKWSERGKLDEVAGGGWQYKAPQPSRYMIYTTSFPQR